MTRGDKIRAMTDEELANWLSGLALRMFEINPWLERPASKERWLDWLKQEVTDNPELIGGGEK